MLPLLIAAGIGLVAGAASASGGNQATHNSNHKHVHFHVHKKPKSNRRRRIGPNHQAKRITSTLYNFTKSNALPPGERAAVHKAIAVVKNKRRGKRKTHGPYYRWLRV